LLSLLPFLLAFFLYRHRLSIATSPPTTPFALSWGSLYATLYTPSPWSLPFPFLFLLRRYLFSACLYLLKVHPPTQLHVQALMSVGLIGYIFRCRPYTVRQDNYVEVYNEGTILAVYTLVSPYVHDNGFTAEKKYEHGFVVAGVILQMIVVNFLLFGINTFRQLRD
jgi:hypothetical protein